RRAHAGPPGSTRAVEEIAALERALDAPRPLGGDAGGSAGGRASKRCIDPARCGPPRAGPAPLRPVALAGGFRGWKARARADRGSGGEGGIRTPGTLAGTPDFESGPF